MRNAAETLELDLSLRQSRTIYVSLAIIFLPIAVAGLVYGISAVAAIIDSLSNGHFPIGLGGSLFALAIATIFVGVEYAAVSQILEANRRLKTLRDYPDQKVRKMPAPFQSSLFGPYH